jgi:predicted transcriptional regulator
MAIPAILDYGKVCVNGLLLRALAMPGIGHYEAIRKEVIRLLQRERERRNLSNYAVAQRSGISESMLSLVERGLRNPTMELMLRVADGIGVDLCVFIRRATHTIIRDEAIILKARTGRLKRKA